MKLHIQEQNYFRRVLNISEFSKSLISLTLITLKYLDFAKICLTLCKILNKMLLCSIKLIFIDKYFRELRSFMTSL